MDAEELLEKIIEARLLAKNLRMPHESNCRIETDPEGYAPCSCGASANNGRLDRIMEVLKTR